MQRTTLFIAALCLTACDGDTEDENLDARLAAIEVDESDDLEDEHHERRHRGKRAHRDPSDRLCEAVSCSDEQREQVKAAFAPPQRKAERPDLSEANGVLSRAFAGEDFSQADLDTWVSNTPERPDRAAHHLETLSELHTIFSADQRRVVATQIANGQLFGRHHGSRHHHRDGEGHHIERFCRPLDCTDTQMIALGELFAERPDHDANRQALAAAFEADTFHADAVSDLLGPPPNADTTIVAMHGVLTADQRAELAQRIAEGGPRAVMGSRRGRHGKHRGRGKGDCDKRRDRDEGPEFG